MKHHLLSMFAVLALTAQTAVAADVPATRLFTETFNSYTAGNELYDGKTWLQYASNTADPIKVTAKSLEYEGYSTTTGNCVTLSNTATGQDLFCKVPTGKEVKTGSFYASFLLNVSEAPTTNQAYFICFITQTKAGISDKKSSSEFAKLFACGDEADNTKYQLGITRATAVKNVVKADTKLSYGTTYLVVLKYTFVDGNTNDTVELFINPTVGSTEPAASAKYNIETGSDASTSYGLLGVELRQGQTTSNNAPVCKIDELHVATSWNGLFDAASTGGGDTAKPTIASALGTTSTGLDPMISGTSVSTQIYITATDLKSDVTITCGEGITCPVASISKDEAGLAGAYKVDFTVTPTLEKSGAWSSTVTFSSEGAESLVFTISCDVLVPTQVTSAAQYRNLYTPEDYSYYKFAGKVTVTAIEAVADSYTPYYKVYAQDATGGICLSTEYMFFDPSSLAVGDKITDFLYMYNGEGSIGLMGVLVQTSETAPVFTKVASGVEVTPLEINPADFTAADYQYRLVKLAGVRFSETGNFEAKSYEVTTPDGATAHVHPFAGSDLIGTAIPAKADVVGISMSKSALVVWPRTLADVTAGAASVNITKQDLYDFKNNPAPVNVKTAVAEFTVVAENLPEAAPIEITGADAAMFSVEPKAVPAGSATTKVTLYYQPTATGKHKGNVIFDFDGINSEFNTAYSVNAMAYDPEHLPTLALDPAEVILTAKVGQKAEASVKLTVANAFDYINAARTNAEVGSIIISSSMFLPTMAESTFKVTFQPKEEGNVEQQFVFTTLKGEPVTLKVKGVTDGGAEPEQPEGGQLVLDDSKPLPYYEQDFANVESNKPMALTGWCNVAEEGTRAWWGYVGDDFKAAKATAYDSKVAPGAGTPCQMLLVTPALDYKNTTDKHVKFSVMGKALIEGMTDKLEICLIEKEGTNTIISPMAGFPIPAIPDEADQWVPIDADMSAIPSMPDVFWIGFRFTSTRGRDNAAQYFIKDFKWSSKGSGISSILADANGLYTVFNLQGILLMKDADLDAVRALAPGFYIVNGRKVRL
ncbi:MAG: hypothetical protein PUA76_07895 [Bacteroidales bacterium]|nr:hypothetical protein [Bacteroidales bacterium]